MIETFEFLSTANIKGIGKTVTLAQALFSLLGYTLFVPIATTIMFSISIMNICYTVIR